MAEHTWGNCKGCRFFNSHNAQPDETEVAQCMQPELREFELQVTGMSGCKEFEARTGVSSGIPLEAEASTMH